MRVIRLSYSSATSIRLSYISATSIRLSYSSATSFHENVTGSEFYNHIRNIYNLQASILLKHNRLFRPSA